MALRLALSGTAKSASVEGAGGFRIAITGWSVGGSTHHGMHGPSWAAITTCKLIPGPFTAEKKSTDGENLRGAFRRWRGEAEHVRSDFVSAAFRCRRRTFAGEMWISLVRLQG